MGTAEQSTVLAACSTRRRLCTEFKLHAVLHGYFGGGN